MRSDEVKGKEVISDLVMNGGMKMEGVQCPTCGGDRVLGKSLRLTEKGLVPVNKTLSIVVFGAFGVMGLITGIFMSRQSGLQGFIMIGSGLMFLGLAWGAIRTEASSGYICLSCGHKWIP